MEVIVEVPVDDDVPVEVPVAVADALEVAVDADDLPGQDHGEAQPDPEEAGVHRGALEGVGAQVQAQALEIPDHDAKGDDQVAPADPVGPQALFHLPAHEEPAVEAVALGLGEMQGQ